MTPLALSLVLASAVIHAVWNGLIKQARLSLVFVWLMVLASVPWFIPVLALRRPPVEVPTVGWLCVVGTALSHTFYYTFMGRGYDVGELSIVYPISRGLGPAVVALGGILVLRESVSPLGLAGVGAIIAGVVGLSYLSGSPDAAGQVADRRAVAYGVGLGLATASNSLIDKVGVGYVAPEVYMLLTHAVAGVFLAPVVLKSCPGRLRQEASGRAWLMAAVAGGLCVVGYLMILHAFRMSNASYVIPARSASVLFAVLLGGRFLGEKRIPGKLLAACAIIGGIWLIAAQG